MTPWWDRVGGEASESDEMDMPPPTRSVYENRADDAAACTIVTATSGPMGGRLLGYEVDGEFVKAEPCCANPALCQRAECWTPIGELR